MQPLLLLFKIPVFPLRVCLKGMNSMEDVICDNGGRRLVVDKGDTFNDIRWNSWCFLEAILGGFKCGRTLFFSIGG